IVEPSTGPTLANLPTPTPTVAENQAPSPDPTVAEKPSSTKAPRSVDRRAQPDNRQLAIKHLEKARVLYYQQRQYQAALAECDEALRLNPQLAAARDLKRRINTLIRILNSR